MGGTIGAPWKALLRREFAALRDGERAEIELAVAQHVKQSNFKKRVNERAWTKEEKQVARRSAFRRWSWTRRVGEPAFSFENRPGLTSVGGGMHSPAPGVSLHTERRGAPRE